MSGGVGAPTSVTARTRDVASRSGHAEDLTLAKRASQGDVEALEILYRDHHRAVGRHLRALLGVTTDVEDVTQEVFLKALRSLARYRGDSSLSTWLHGIAIHVARNVRDKQRRRHELQPSAADVERDRPATPEAEVAGLQAADRLYAALGELPDAEREAFTLRVLEHMPLAEAARLLDTPPSTLSERCARAEQKLRAALDGGEGHTT